MPTETLLIGAHVSAAGGAYKAPYRGQEIGATTIQIFTSNQKQWKGRIITPEEVDLWNKALDETGIQEVMSHSSYLINVGSPKDELREKSINAFRAEIERCHLLNIPYLNFHPGAATGSSVEECLDRISQALLELEPTISKGNTAMVLEATAGQGTSVGHDFKHLGYIIDKTKDKLPMGVCIDTCHIFAAGYDIRTKEAWEKTLKAFDEQVGLQYLKGFHLNDSKHDLGSKKDRHDHLGKGKIGMECFEFLMTCPKTRHLPKYLETPLGDQYWKDEIKLLTEMAKQYA